VARRMRCKVRISLTGLLLIQYSFSEMVKWCTALILIIVLTGGALAGVPVHSGEKHCPMMGTDDCCETAQSQSTTPEVYTARLCCSLNCRLPGTTVPTNTVPKLPSVALALQGALITRTTYLPTMRGLLANSAPERNQHSPPFYIQHLALLI
jgi:hypothetical protein